MWLPRGPLGSGIKQFSGGDLHFKPNGTCLTLSISQDKVCRKVQEAKWECEPLFSAGRGKRIWEW